MRGTIILLTMPVLLFFAGLAWLATLWTRHQ